MEKKQIKNSVQKIVILFVSISFFFIIPAHGEDLGTIKQSGVLKHLGIPYANFVTERGTGLDIELMQAFARYLGVEYKFVGSTWKDIIPDLSGKEFKVVDTAIKVTGSRPKKGNVISTGFTVLPWRKNIVSFSDQTFPSGIWLVSRGDSSLKPIKPTGNIATDINLVKKELYGITVLGLKGSCLAPSQYGLDSTGAKIKYFPPENDLDGMIPAVIAKNADATLIDVPVALVALAKWPGKIKVIGPISERQEMACAFAKDSPKLKQAFGTFFKRFKKSGEYKKLVDKYYPTVFTYYPEFLSENSAPGN